MEQTAIMEQLKNSGNPIVLRNLQYRGAGPNAYGVPARVLAAMGKAIPHDNQLAKSLYETGNLDAMRLSALAAIPESMTQKDFEEMLSGAYCFLLVDSVVAELLSRATPDMAFKLAAKWKHSTDSRIQSAGWAALSKLILRYPAQDYWKYNLSSHLKLAKKKYARQTDAVRFARSNFIQTAGIYLPFGRPEALRYAEKISPDKVRLSSQSLKLLDPKKAIETAISSQDINASKGVSGQAEISEDALPESAKEK